MEGQFLSILEDDMKLELIQIDCYGVNFGIFSHFFISLELIENKRDFIRTRDTKKNLMVRTIRKPMVSYHKPQIMSIFVDEITPPPTGR